MNELLGLLLEVTGIQRTLIGGAGGNRVTLVIERYLQPQPPARLAAIACKQPAVGLRRILITPCLGRQCAKQCLLVAVGSRALAGKQGDRLLPLASNIEQTGQQFHPCRLPGDRCQSVAQYLDRAFAAPQTCRSEEHTSELQSLMRISYAVFCLKKKT